MQLRVSTRLWLVFGTIFFLILLSALVVRHRLNQSSALADQTSAQSMPMALLAADMKLQAVQVQQAELLRASEELQNKVGPAGGRGLRPR